MPTEQPIFTTNYRGYDYSLTFVQHPDGITVEVDIDVDRYPTRQESGLHGDYETARRKGSAFAKRLIDQLFSG